MEITERFPQELGNLAQNARFPHSHKPIPLFFRGEERRMNRPQVDQFPSGVLVYFSSGASSGPWQSPPWTATFRSPRQAIWRGDGRVPIYFVDVAELLDAIRDGVLTITELQLLPSLKVGHATHYEFVQLNSTRANSFPTLREGQTQTTAHGLLDDGRTFEFSRNTHGPNATAVKIAFQ